MRVSEEEWKPVVGWEGLYEVSSLGRVKSFHRGSRILKPARQHNNRPQVALYRNGVKKPRLVNRLVAEAFIPNPDGKPFVLHWDDDPQNNRVTNLRWGSHSENMLDSVRNGTHFQSQKTHCKHGHEYTPENTKKTRNGRTCRKCAREATRKAYLGKGETPTDFSKVPHGTPSGYEYHRCRCLFCKRAHANKNRGTA